MDNTEQKVMTPAQFRREMESIAKLNDTERRHVDADHLMEKILVSLGYEDGISVFKSMNKWYS